MLWPWHTWALFAEEDIFIYRQVLQFWSSSIIITHHLIFHTCLKKKKVGSQNQEPWSDDDTQELAFDLPNLSSDNYWPGLLTLSSVENATPIQTLWLDKFSVLLFTFWKILFVESVASLCGAPVRTPPLRALKAKLCQDLMQRTTKVFTSISNLLLDIL